jgi:hypothetical protein
MTDIGNAPYAAVKQNSRWLLWLFLVAAGHRVLQWLLLQKQFMHVAELNGDILVMQLLPAALWREQFWAALLYLQQTPPLPNLVYGIVARCFDDLATRAAFLVLLCGLLSCIVTALLALLLSRLAFPRIFCCAVALVFAFSADVVMVEYFAFGQAFYEQITMILVLAAVLAAQRLAMNAGFRAALALGAVVALLALTRASFSYFALPVLAWVLWVTRRHVDMRVIAGFLLPVLLLHGGWALKQKIVQGELLWATSSWGGLNMQIGDMRRGMAPNGVASAAGFDMARQAEQTPCLLKWRHLWGGKPFEYFSGAFDMFTPAPGDGPSAAALDVDAAATKARGQRVVLDTAALREFSQCLQRARLGYWLQNPLSAVHASWQSYSVFWSPAASLVETAPTVLIPEHLLWKDPANLPLWKPQGDLWRWPSYNIRQEKYRLFLAYWPQDLAPATTLLLPVLPGLFALVAMLAVHAMPLVAAALCIARRHVALSWPAGTGFMVLAYLYIAGVTSLVEYGENMRFRLEIEPVIWALGLMTVRMIWQWWRSGKSGVVIDRP